jgi:hypothetical protein
MAFPIEHEDRVILDTFHKQAKLLIALPQLFGSPIERNPAVALAAVALSAPFR